MKNRSPAAVFFLPLITFGIYGLVWEVKTKNEMNKLGADIPTAWLIIIPLVNIWWLWKYSEGVGKVTKDQLSAVIAFLLLFLLGIIGMAIVQNEFNKVGAQSAGAADAAPQAAAPPSPAASEPVADASPEPADKPDDTPTPPAEPPSPVG